MRWTRDIRGRRDYVEQRLEQAGGLRVGHTPADHAAAENVQNDVLLVAGFQPGQPGGT